MIRCLALLFCLAACAGGSGIGPAPAPGFDQLFNQATADEVTFFAALPATGTASYHGPVRLNLPMQMGPAQPHQGDLRVDITFAGADDPVTGAITGLHGAAGPALGTLQISGGQLYAEARPAPEYQFTANLAGALTQNGQIHDLNGVLTGDFTGQNGATIAGLAYGTIEAGDEVDLFDGAFVADRIPSGG